MGLCSSWAQPPFTFGPGANSDGASAIVDIGTGRLAIGVAARHKAAADSHVPAIEGSASLVASAIPASTAVGSLFENMLAGLQELHGVLGLPVEPDLVV